MESQAGAYGERPDVLAYRVRENARALEALQNWRRDVDSERAARSVELKDLHEDMQELKRTTKRVLWSLITLTLTIAGSSIAIVLAMGHP